MRTLVLSDLHLASRTEADVLRLPQARAALEAALGDVDRLVLLGDVLELRHGPLIDAVDAARPVFEGIGAALPAHAEVVLLAGNHDHALVAPWLERRAFERRPPLGLEERPGPGASEATAHIAEWIGGDRVDVAYPGVWLRPDVYATHGHYLDRHLTVPTFERLCAGAMARVVGRPIGEAASADDYEAVLGPLYAWLHVVARGADGFGAERQRGTQSAWTMLQGKGRRSLRERAMVAAFPLLVRGLNRAGLGPVRSEISPQELRRSALAAMGEVTARLGLHQGWVIFGHTHRVGPREGDDPAEWRGRNGVGLVNTGSWVHEPVFIGGRGASSPYWPGHVVEVDPEPGSAPRVRALLADASF